MDKQYALAVILIILGLGLNQSGSSNPFFQWSWNRSYSNGNILGINSIDKRIEEKIIFISHSS